MCAKSGGDMTRETMKSLSLYKLEDNRRIILSVLHKIYKMKMLIRNASVGTHNEQLQLIVPWKNLYLSNIENTHLNSTKFKYKEPQLF